MLAYCHLGFDFFLMKEMILLQLTSLSFICLSTPSLPPCWRQVPVTSRVYPPATLLLPVQASKNSIVLGFFSVYVNCINLYLRFCYLLFIQHCFLRSNLYKSNSFILVSIQYPLIYHDLLTHDGVYRWTFGFLRDFTIAYHVPLNTCMLCLLGAKVSLRNTTRGAPGWLRR